MMRAPRQRNISKRTHNTRYTTYARVAEPDLTESLLLVAGGSGGGGGSRRGHALLHGGESVEMTEYTGGSRELHVGSSILHGRK